MVSKKSVGKYKAGVISLIMKALLTFSLLFGIYLPLFSEAETITISADEATFFHHVMCASDAAATLEALEVEAETHKDDIAKLKLVANKSNALAIAAGKKIKRQKAYVLTFIKTRSNSTIEFNNRYIQTHGFENFAKVAPGGLLKLCSIRE